MEFEKWRCVGYHSPSRRACEAGFGEVWKGELHVSVHRTEELSGGFLSGAKEFSGVSNRGEGGTGQTCQEGTGHVRCQDVLSGG